MSERLDLIKAFKNQPEVVWGPVVSPAKRNEQQEEGETITFCVLASGCKHRPPPCRNASKPGRLFALVLRACPMLC